MSSPPKPEGGDPQDELPGEKTFVDPNVYDGHWDESTLEERGQRKAPPDAAAQSVEAPPAPRLARLRVTGGSDRGREFVVREQETSVGRGTMNGIILTDLAVSRRHLVVLFDGESYKLRDLGSGNGTVLNGEPIENEVVLRDGDVIELGKTTLRFAFPGAVQPPRPTPEPPMRGASSPYNSDVAVRQTLPLGTSGALAPRRPSQNPVASPPPRPTRGLRIVGFFAAGIAMVAAVFGLLALVGPRRQPTTVAVPIPAPVPVPIPAPPPAAVVPAAPVTAAPPPGLSVTPLTDEPKAARAVPVPAPVPVAAPVPPKKKVQEAALPILPEHPAEKTALVQYRDKQFAEAARILRAAADAEPQSASRLNGIAKDYVAVGAGVARGDANMEQNPPMALVAYQDALAADLRYGGFHASAIRAKIGRVAPAAAAAYIGANRYEQARAACDVATNFGSGGDDRVIQVRKQLETKARELYLAAQELEKDRPDEARSLYRRVTQIVPEGSFWHAKASGSLH